MRVFLTLSLLASLVTMLAGMVALTLALPGWTAPLLGLGTSPAVIAVGECVRKMWSIDSGDLCDVSK